MKRKHIGGKIGGKLLPLIMVMAVILMGSITASAANDDDSVTGNDSVVTDSAGVGTDDSTTSSVDDDVQVSTGDDDSRYNIGLETANPSANDTGDDGTAATPKPTKKPKVKNKTKMSATSLKDKTKAVKTGETNAIPIIISLGIIAVCAGVWYMTYVKKKK